MVPSQAEPSAGACHPLGFPRPATEPCRAVDECRAWVNLENIMHHLPIIFLTPNRQEGRKPRACYFSCQCHETNGQEVLVVHDSLRQSNLAGPLRGGRCFLFFVFFSFSGGSYFKIEHHLNELLQMIVSVVHYEPTGKSCLLRVRSSMQWTGL